MNVFSKSIVQDLLCFSLLCFSALQLSASNISDYREISGFEFNAAEEGVNIELKNSSGELIEFNGSGTFTYGKEEIDLYFKAGVALVEVNMPENLNLFTLHIKEKIVREIYHISDKDAYWRYKKIPLWYSILPPLLAIVLALIFKEVIISLFSAVWLGVYIVNGLDVAHIISSLLKVVDTYVITVLQDSGHLSIIIFSLLIGAMVALITKNGGMQGIVNKLTPFAKNSKMAQFITWLLGVLIFFDDYANTLVVGNTMRPLTDRFKISREKLAYIVDSTAAPIASVAFITTWIGAELGYIESALKIMKIDESPYSVFLNSLQYSYYPFLTLFFILLLIFMKKDFGPMKKAEENAANPDTAEYQIPEQIDEEMQPKENVRPHWYNAFFPVLMVVGGTIAGLIITGHDSEIWHSSAGFLSKLSTTVGNADSYQALVWASLLGLLTAMALSIGGKILNIPETADSIMIGFKSLLQPVVILVAAWSLAIITEELHTSTFLISITEGKVSILYFPLITFLLAAVTAFSTGSSWSTMAILYPIILPAAYALGVSEGLPTEDILPVIYHLTAAVIGGSVLGDHCSPISDTTILSSLASGCDHLSHVKTQLPYALTVGFVCLVCGGLFFALGLPWWLGYPVGIVALYSVVRLA
ncbi:MAG: Na+/H+ antiporter NhaC family protein [Chitinophagales bacterium]